MNALVPRFPSANDVEALSVELATEKVTEITLDLTLFRRSRLFAESRMLGLLVLALRNDIPIYVRIGSTPDKRGELPAKYSKVFIDSVFGLIVGLLATAIVDRSGKDQTIHVRDQVISELRTNAGLVWSGAEIAAPIIDRFGYPPPSEFVAQQDLGSFAARFKELIFRDLGLSRLNEKLINSICEYAFEILQNTTQHGSSDLQQKPLDGIRFLSIRRLNFTPDELRRLVEDDNRTPLISYLDQLSECFVIKPQQLVEVTITDSGIGIPARMLGSMDVYSAPIEEERKALAVALSPSGTSKGNAVMGAGLGLFKVMEATRQLKGLIVFRTGRSCMYRHYLKEPGDNNELSLELLSWANTSYQLVAGTSVSLIFPWAEAAQLELI